MKKNIILIIATIILILSEFVFVKASHHSGSWWHHVRTFYLVLGVLGSIALMLGAKIIGSKLLHKKRNYYDSESSS